MNNRLPLAAFTALPLLLGVGSRDLAAADPSGEQAIDVIVVTASRLEKSIDTIPGAASIVSAEDIQAGHQQFSLDESMARVPGLFFQNRYNPAQDLRIAIRGFGSRSNFGVRGIKIFVDGIPETLADGQTQVDSIDPGSVASIEVLRGPSSAQYGNAAGGVINITTESGGTDGFVEAWLSQGEYGFSKQQVKAAGGSEQLNYSLHLSQTDFDGYRQHSLAENTLINTRLTWHPDDATRVGLVFSHTDQPVSDDAGGLTREEAEENPRQARDRNVQYDAGEALDQQKIGISFARETAAGGKFTARNYYLWRDFANKLPFTGGGAVQFDRFFAGAGAWYLHPLSVAGRESQLVLGFDLDRQDDDRKRFDNNDGETGDLTFDQNETVTSTGLFVENEWSLREAAEISLGLRYDRVEFDVTDRFLADGDDSGSRTLDALSPMLAAVFDIAPSVNIYATISSSFQTPTSTEFANPDGSGGFNPFLEPQFARNYELGLRGSPGELQRLELAVFSIDVEDELIPYEIESNPGRDYYANAGQSTRNGVEFSYTITPTPSLRFLLSYTFSDFRFDRFVDDNGNDFAGNHLPGIPQHFAFAELAYRHSQGAYGIFDVQYVDELFANNANTDTIDAHTIANLRLGFDGRIGPLDIGPFIGVHNLFDTDYTANVRINAFGGRYFEPGPGRNAYAGVSVRYGFD